MRVSPQPNSSRMELAADSLRPAALAGLRALLSCAAGAGLGWFLAPAAMRLADGRAWPRIHSAMLAGAVFAIHSALRRPVPPSAAGTPAVQGALCGLEFIILLFLGLAAQIDLAARIVPNELVGAMLGTGLVRMALVPSEIPGHLLGLAIVGGLMLVVGLAGRGALGAGDVKLLGAAGLYLGWRAGVLAFLLSFAFAGVTSLILICLRLRERRDMLPFAPFLSAGIWTAMLLGGGALSAIWPLLAP